MKNTLLFILVIFSGLVACHSTNSEESQVIKGDSTSVIADTLPRKVVKYKKSPQQIEEERIQDIADSINSVKTLELALKISNENKYKKSFFLETDSFSIQYGFILSSTVKHLKIIRNFIHGIKIIIYSLKEDQFEIVFFKELYSIGFVGDTLRDVNGDGRVDYLIHTYPPSGCCHRDVFKVYLQKQNGNFAKEVEFINPTFSPVEKIIRGICYGHFPPYYKYKWNGGKVDTIEYIFLPDSTNDHHYIKKRTWDDNEKGIKLEELPKEYENINYF